MISFINTLFTKFKNNKEFRVVLFFNLVSIIGALAVNKLVTTYVEPKDLGELLLYMNLASWVTIPIAAFYLYFMHMWPQALFKDTTEELRSLVRKITFYFILFSAALVTIFPVFNLSIILNPFNLFLIWIIALGQASHLLISPIVHAERRRKLAGFFDLCNSSLGRFGIIISLVFILKQSEVINLIQFQAVYSIFILVMAILIFYFIKKPATNNSQQSLKSHFQQNTVSWPSFVIPGFITALTTQIATASERWILSDHSNLDNVSYFVLALGLCTAASSAFVSVISNYYYPLLTNSASSEDYENVSIMYKKYLFLVILSQLSLFLIFVLISDTLTNVFFDIKYSVIKTVLPILFFGVGIGAIATSQNVIYYIKRMTLIPNIFKVTSSLFYIAIIYFGHFNHIVSLSYLSWAFVASQILYFLLMQSRIRN